MSPLANSTSHQPFQPASQKAVPYAPNIVSLTLTYSSNSLPRPIMTARKQRRAEFKHHWQTGTMGHPSLCRPKETKESHARMVARIKRQIGPSPLPPAEQTTSPRASDARQGPASGLSTHLQTAVSWVQYGFSRLSDMSIGLPMAEAAKPQQYDEDRLSVEEFIEDLRSDFDIQKSFSLNLESSLKGVTIIIGEDHYDHAMRRQIARVISYLKADQHDVLFMEGDKAMCEERRFMYKLPSGCCIPLEDHSATYVNTRTLVDRYTDAITEGAEFIHRALPHLPWENVQKNLKGYMQFVERYENNLPAKAWTQYQALAKKIKKLELQGSKSIMDTSREREAFMLQKIREQTHPDATRFFIIGQLHLQHLAPTVLRQPNVIAMVPHLIIKEGNAVKLPVPTHDEL